MRMRSFVTFWFASFVLLGCAGVITTSQHPTEQYTKIFAAASSGDSKTVRAAVDADPSLVSKTEWEGLTLLMDAVDNGQVEVARYLLEARSDISARDSDGRSPLHIAAQHGDNQMVTMLLQYGASINALDKRGWTPLDRATSWGHPDTASLLEKSGGRSGSLPR